MALERLGLGAILDFEADAAIAEMKRARGHVAKLRGGLQNMGRGAGQMAAGFGRAMGSIVPVVLATSGAIAGATQRFASFENGLIRVGTLLKGGTAEAMKFGPAVEKLAVKFGQSLGNTNEALFQTISAGVAGAEATNFLTVANKAAAAGYADLGQTITVLAGTVNAYGDQLGANISKTDKAARVANVLLKTNELGVTTLGKLAGALGNVTATAALGGVQIEELGAGMASLTQAMSGKTNEAVTSLNQLILGIVSPADKAKKAFGDLTIPFGEAGLAAHGFAGVLAIIKEKTGGSVEAMRALFPNIRAFKAASILAGQGAGKFTESLDAMRKAAGFTDEKFRDVSKGFTFQFKRSLAALEVALVRIGGVFVEELGISPGKAADKLEGAFNRIEKGARFMFSTLREGFETLDVKGRLARLGESFGKLGSGLEAAFGTDANRKALGVALALAVMAGAAAPLLLVLLPIVGVFSGLITAASGLVTMFGGLGTVGAAVGGIFSGPVGLGIAAAAAIIAVVATNAGGAGSAFMRLVGTIREAVLPVWEKLKGLWEAVQPTIQILGAVIGSALAPVFDVLGFVVASVFKQFGFFIDIITIAMRFLNPLIALVGGTLVVAFKLIGGLLNTLILPAFEGVQDAIGFLIDGLMDAIRWIIRVHEKVASFLGLTGKSIANVGRMEFFDEGGKQRIGGGKEAGEAIAKAKGAQTKATVEGAAAAAQQKQVIDNKVTVKIDGRKVAEATSRATLELTERAGASVTPWQRRQIIERGSVLSAATSG